jgi:hypothetical protein
VGSVAPDIEVVTAQLRVIVPENELPAVTVMVEVSPLVAPGLTRMLPLLVSVKPLLPQVGHCQKSPHPVRKKAKNGVAASINLDQLPIFIAAPFALRSGHEFFQNPSTGYRPDARPVLEDDAHTPAFCSNDALRRGFA